MRKVAVIAVGLGAVALVGPSISSGGRALSAAGQSLSAAMTPQQVVTPAGKPWGVPGALAHANGSFTGTISADKRQLRWQISYAKLNHENPVIADVHIGKAGHFGPILLRLCGPCRSGQTGVAKLKTGYGRELATGDHWVTLITGQYPNGVVRGQIKVR
jgi:hypothetical protein